MLDKWKWWGACGLAILLPWIWLGGNTLGFAWLYNYPGSLFLFWLTGVTALAILALASIKLSSNRWRRLLAFCLLASLLLIQIVAILSWAYFSMGFGTWQPKIQPSTSWMKPLGSEWGRQSPGKEHSIRIVSDVQRNGIDSLRFELREGETYSDLFGKTSFRSEVNARDFPRMGSEKWYCFSFLLPSDFPIEDNRLVLAQWHGADKKYLGEPSRSPSLAFRYSGGRFFITIRHSADRVVWDPRAAPSQTLFETHQFPLGVWNDFLVQAKWSFQGDGFVNVWWNSDPIVAYSGPVGYNDDFGPYFKFGMYRDDTKKTYVVYFNNVRMGGIREEVSFGN